MNLGKVPMKAGGGAKQNTSLGQATQVSKATTTRHRHAEKPTNLYTYHSQEGWKRRGKLPHKCTIWSSKLHDLLERVRVI